MDNHEPDDKTCPRLAFDRAAYDEDEVRFEAQEIEHEIRRATGMED
jgi:hypothetical protein